MKLTDTSIQKAKPDGKVRKLTDGGGLFLQVEPTGGKLWRYNFRFQGKQKTLSLGRYPDVSLQEARKRHRGAREQLASGIDPSAVKRAEKAAGKDRAANSFEVIALEWLDRWKSDKIEHTCKKTIALLQKDVFPYIGNRPIAELSAPEVLTVLRRVEGRAVDTAYRVKNVISMIMRYAIATGRADRDPCPDLRGALTPRPQTKHFPTILEPSRIGELLRAIDAYRGGSVVKAALRLAPLLFVRPGELRMMRWADVDLDGRQWCFVSKKRRKEMIVPLSRQAVDILRELQPLTSSSEYVFPGQRWGRPISDKALIHALHIMEYDTKNDQSIHGFRATARTLISEKLRIAPELIELQLTHEVPDTLKGAYNRTKFLDDRRNMMQLWSDYLDGLKATKPGMVIPLVPHAGQSTCSAG